MNELTQLCRPLLRRICEYWAFKQRGVEVPEREVRADLRSEFDRLKEQCEKSPELKAAYERIEKPLVFFIDYTIKEGGFSYSRSWREIARDYNELSGDEKFFDLLEEAKGAENAEELLEVFYLMLELGFDGALKRDQSELLLTLQDCGSRVPVKFNVTKDLLTEQPVAHIKHRRSTPFIYSIWCKLLLCGIVAAAALGYNLWTLNEVTSPYMKQLQEALYEASPEVWVGSRGQNRADVLRQDALDKVKALIGDKADQKTELDKRIQENGEQDQRKTEAQ